MVEVHKNAQKTKETNLNGHTTESKVNYTISNHNTREKEGATCSPNQLQGQWRDHEKAGAYDQFLTTAQNPLQSFYQPITFNYRYEVAALKRA